MQGRRAFSLAPLCNDVLGAAPAQRFSWAWCWSRGMRAISPPPSHTCHSQMTNRTQRQPDIYPVWLAACCTTADLQERPIGRGLDRRRGRVGTRLWGTISVEEAMLTRQHSAASSHLHEEIAIYRCCSTLRGMDAGEGQGAADPTRISLRPACDAASPVRSDEVGEPTQGHPCRAASPSSR